MATILTTADNDKILVKFNHNELGSQSIKDYQVIVTNLPQTTNYIHKDHLQDDTLSYDILFNNNNNNNNNNNENEHMLLQEIDYNAMAAMFMFLDRKAKLIQLIS
jgi:hypothetical protein